MNAQEAVKQIQAGNQISVTEAEYGSLRGELVIYNRLIKDSDAVLFVSIVQEMKRLDLEFKAGAYNEDKWFDCVYTDRFFSVMMIPDKLIGLAIKPIFVTIHFTYNEWEQLRVAVEKLEANRRESQPGKLPGSVDFEIPDRRFVVKFGGMEYFAFVSLMQTCSLEYVTKTAAEVLKLRFGGTEDFQQV